MTKDENIKTKKTKNVLVSKSKSTDKTNTRKKTIAKETSAKKTSPKKTNQSNVTSKSIASKKTANPTKKVTSNIMEYYDLPYGYNKTTVKLLFQTPKKLFVYWEISEDDKKKFYDNNGNDFFENTSPFLVIKNKTKNYSFEIEVNDFANSWYFDVPDSNCEYEVELIRKHKVTQSSTLITTSNQMEVPNNRILFEQNRKEIFFKNVKTNNVTSKSVVNLQFINHLGNVFNANSFYKKFYHEEDLYTLNNPSSN